MSKGNMLLGQAKGKVGDIVFYRSNGQQQTRAKAAKVANPRTLGQSIQRVLMKNCILVYAALKEICDHSFQNLPYGAPNQRAFMKANLDILREIAATSESGWGSIPGLVPVGGLGFPAWAFQISKGTLPKAAVSTHENVQIVLSDLKGSSSYTYQDVCDKLGLQRGDQLTFVGVYGDDKSYYTKIARVILDPYDSGQQAEMSSPCFSLDNDGIVKNPNPKNEGNVYFGGSQAVTTESLFELNDPGAASMPMISCAVILSRKADDGSWLRSKQNLIPTEYGLTLYDTLQEAAYAASAGTIELPTENPYYLNGAENI